MILLFRDQIVNKLQAHKEQLAHSIINGNIQDIVSYKHIIGKIRGIEDAIEIIKEVFKGEDNNAEKSY